MLVAHTTANQTLPRSVKIPMEFGIVTFREIGATSVSMVCTLIFKGYYW